LVERIKDGRGKGRRMEALTKLSVLSLAGFIISDEFRPAILWNPQSIKRSQNGGASCILTSQPPFFLFLVWYVNSLNRRAGLPVVPHCWVASHICGPIITANGVKNPDIGAWHHLGGFADTDRDALSVWRKSRVEVRKGYYARKD
jgi:hypothetical protein